VGSSYGCFERRDQQRGVRILDGYNIYDVNYGLGFMMDLTMDLINMNIVLIGLNSWF
jgi:hypothetical protein